MRINLADIPEEGRQYVWNNQTGEINAILSDLIGTTAYESEFFIRPLNSKDFEMTGFIRTALPEECSRCGIDFNMKINEKFREIMIPRQEDTRTGKYAKVNHISEANEEGPAVLEYDGAHLEMGEYLHEIVALAAPFNPAPEENEKGDCSLCLKSVRGKAFLYDEEMPVEKANTAFEVLKNLKLN